MATAGVVPALLERKERSVAETFTQLPGALARQALKQVQWALSLPNRQLGQPFLQGNFAPQLSEIFTQNLPLLTAAVPAAAGLEAGHNPAKAAASKMAAAAAADNGSNGVHHAAAPAAAANGHANVRASDHANGNANGHASGVLAAAATNDGDDDVKQQRDTLSSSNGISSSSNPFTRSSSSVLHGSLDKLPAGLEGVFLRVGPNPLLKPLGGYHWFDGDGMVHAVRIKDGAASYCNRWVPTSRLAQESAAGWPLFLKLGDYVGLGGLGLIFLERAKTAVGLVDKTAGGGTANTALACHAGRLLALNEGDMPHALRVMCDGLVEALGRVTVTGAVGRSFTAHPKLDPATGELHFFRYTFEAPPYVSYGVLGPQGDLTASLDISADNLKRPIMMHDFAITQNWIVFLDNPLCFDGERMVKQRNLPFSFKPERGSRVGLLRRGAADDSGMIWFDLPAHMVFHVANAWEEEDGTVKLFVCSSESISLNLDTRTEGAIPAAEQPRLAVITLNPNSSSSSSSSRTDVAGGGSSRAGFLRLMTETAGDFPTINPRFVGRKQRYAYVATMVTGFGAAVKWDGVAKMDLWAEEGSDAVVAKIQLPEGCYNGETVFVPRHDDPAKCTSEDDGYLITYVHDESVSSSSSGSGSSLVVWDAATMSQEPLAVVALPQRVPYGFHALWVPEGQFQQQLKSQPLLPTSLAVRV